MHEVLVNRLGGLSLPRKSVVRLTDRPDMTLDVYRGRKTTIQQQEQILMMCRVQEGQLLLLYFRSYFPLIVSDAISSQLHNLNILWYIIMTLYSYVEQVLTMCHIQDVG